jgi:ABC-2 type transport system permease protein
MVLKTLTFRSLQKHRRGIIGWTLGIILLVSIQLAVYPTIRSSSKDWTALINQFPESFRKILRMVDYASERGYLTTELLSFTLPFILISLGASWGARLVTEDEELGTSDIVLSLPIARWTYTLARFLAVFIVLVTEMGAFFITVVIGTRLLDLSIPVSQYLAATFSLFGIAFLIMNLAATIGAATGKRTSALGISMAVAIALFVLYSLAPLVDAIDATMRFNPMQWTIGSQPLFRGVSIGYTLCTYAASVPLILATFYFFERRDISN